MKLILILLLASFIAPVSAPLMAKPRGQLHRSVYVPDALIAPLKLRGAVKDVTETRLFVETVTGVEHMIKIDGRTAIIDQAGKSHRACEIALLTRGLTVDVELDSRDIIKSAVKVVLPCRYRN